MWIKTHHCSWDDGEMRIVQQYCKRRGGVFFKLFDGQAVHYFKTMEEAQKYADANRDLIHG